MSVTRAPWPATRLRRMRRDDFSRRLGRGADFKPAASFDLALELPIQQKFPRKAQRTFQPDEIAEKRRIRFRP